jgi:hypothetical protein
MKIKLIGLFLLNIAVCIQAQKVNSYEMSAEFFPEDAQMYNNPVSPDAFMRANSLIEFSEISDEEVIFYLHGELVVDSIFVHNKKIEFKSEKVLFYYSYNMVAIQVTITSNDVITDKGIRVYYSGFINPSRARGLSDYMLIDKNKGVFLRSYGYSLWFPIFIQSGQDSYDVNFKKVTVKLPADFKCIVAGELVDEYVENDIYTAVWKPGIIDITDIQCAAQKYQVVSNKNVFVYYVSNKLNGEKILDYAIKLKELYSKNLKAVNEEVPLYIMKMPRYGDISSGNVVGVSEKNFNSFDDGLISKLTIAHELVHPYVDIPVSINNPFYAFVVEGFPSFFQAYALKRIDGESYNLNKVMKGIEKSYLEKRRTGLTRRGNKLPVEKAILKIEHNEIGSYKDRFVLRDRVWLFFYDIWNQMGDEKFDMVLKELFSFNSINYESFEGQILKYLPDYGERLNIWLNTTDYPNELRLID